MRLVVVDEGIASNDSDALPPCAAEMRPENPTVKRQELAMRTICALDSGLSAHTAIPLVSARRRITDTPRFLVKVALRIHIAAHDEQQVEQRKLLGARARRGHDAIVRRLTRLEPRVPGLPRLASRVSPFTVGRLA